MKFKLSSEKKYFNKADSKRLKKLGFKFIEKKASVYPEPFLKTSEGKDIEFDSLGDAMEFIKEHKGKLLASGDIVL
jgi:uncharacterized protein with gpF-like domain